MSNLTFRTGRGKALSHTEMDNNFKYLREWEPNTPYSKDMYVYYTLNGKTNLFTAKYNIPGQGSFNPNDWNPFGEEAEGVNGKIKTDVFDYEENVTESPFELTETLSQLVAVEINGNDRIDTQDYYFDEPNNQIFWTSSIFDLSDGDTIVVKYLTNESEGSGVTTKDPKDIRTVAPNEGESIIVLETDEYISIKSTNVSSFAAFELPAQPEIGFEVKLFDGSGNIQGSGINYVINADTSDSIQGNPSLNINQNWQTRTLCYIGGNIWKII